MTAVADVTDAFPIKTGGSSEWMMRVRKTVRVSVCSQGGKHNIISAFSDSNHGNRRTCAEHAEVQATKVTALIAAL